MRRRDFISLIGSAAATWPLAAGAQQTERMRRIGVFVPYAADDQEGHARLAAFRQGLQDLGWTDGKNLHIDIRWGGDDRDRYRQYAAELVALAPDVLVGVTSPTAVALQQQTRTVPIVFVGVIDPVGVGLVTSLAHPSGNVTGFTVFEYGLSPKWLSGALQGRNDPNFGRNPAPLHCERVERFGDDLGRKPGDREQNAARIFFGRHNMRRHHRSKVCT